MTTNHTETPETLERYPGVEQYSKEQLYEAFIVEHESSINLNRLLNITLQENADLRYQLKFSRPINTDTEDAMSPKDTEKE